MTGPKMKYLDASAFFIILLASLLHLTWAGLLLYSPAAAYSTPVSAVVLVSGSRTGAVLALSLTAVLALGVAQFYRDSRLRHPEILGAGLIPQQFFLLASAAGDIDAAVRGHYADGVARAWPFILSDQLAVVLVALFYSIAILIVSRPPRENGGAGL